MVGRRKEEIKGNGRLGALQLVALVEKALIQSLDLAEGKQDPEPTLLSKDMQREGIVHQDSPAEPALIRVQQTSRKNTGPWLQPCLSASPFNSIPDHTYPGSSGPSQETSSTVWPSGQHGKGHVLW